MKTPWAEIAGRAETRKPMAAASPDDCVACAFAHRYVRWKEPGVVWVRFKLPSECNPRIRRVQCVVPGAVFECREDWWPPRDPADRAALRNSTPKSGGAS